MTLLPQRNAKKSLRVCRRKGLMFPWILLKGGNGIAQILILTIFRFSF